MCSSRTPLPETGSISAFACRRQRAGGTPWWRVNALLKVACLALPMSLATTSIGSTLYRRRLAECIMTMLRP